MTSWGDRPAVTPVGHAISWRVGLLLSIIVHMAMITFLLLSPRLFSHDPAADPPRASLAAAEPQRPPDLVPPPTDSLLNSRGNAPERVDRVETEVARGRDRGPHPSPEQVEASVPAAASSARVAPGGSLGDTLRNLAASAWALMELVGNHLWQSTLCLAVAALLTLALKRNRARVRSAIWVAASVKFLVPFAALMTLGRQFGWRTSDAVVQPTLTVLIDTMSQPFSRPSAAIATAALPATSSYDLAAVLPLVLVAIWLSGCVVILFMWWMGWRRLANVVRNASPIRHGQELDILRRLEARAGITTPTTLVASNTSLEPGVFGLTKPVLLWPRGIAERLTVAQVEALIAHEVCHVRRRDNLVAAVHMIIEALFWFHPLVWWLETRLVDERERACDEEVVRWGHEPVVYAESILKTCEFYAESPLTCVAGVTGADLKKRIEAIMRNQDGEVLGAWRTLLLATVGIATVAVPIIIGTLSAPLIRAQSRVGAGNAPAFEAASVKPSSADGRGRGGLDPQPGGRLTGTKVTAAELIQFAYELPDFQTFGGPDWLKSDRFAVVAKAEGDPPVAQKRLMLRRLLAERFKLAAHTEMRELPFYALVKARSDGRIGPQLRRSDADCARVDQPSLDFGVGPSPGNGPARCGYFGFAPGTNVPSGRGGLGFRGLTMAALAKVLVPMVRRSVSDQTGLIGYFDADFDFMTELPPPPPPPGVPNPWGEFVSVFTVLPEQLGLKLDSRRGPVQVLVIDRAEQPTPD